MINDLNEILMLNIKKIMIIILVCVHISVNLGKHFTHSKLLAKCNLVKYSSNKIKKTQDEHLIIIWQNLVDL